MAASTSSHLQTRSAHRWGSAAMRMLWVVTAIVVLNLVGFGLPARYAQLNVVPQASLAEIAWLGLGLRSYAAVLLAGEVVLVVGFTLAATILFWHRSDEPMVLFVALLLLLLGTMNGVLVRSPWALAAQHPALIPICAGLTGFTYALFILFCLLFPDGRFPGRWAGWAAGALAMVAGNWVVAERSEIAATLWGRLPSIGIPLLIGLAGVQIYRCLGTADLVQRQQTRWVVGGLVAASIGMMEAIFLLQGLSTSVPEAAGSTGLVALVGCLVGVSAMLLVPIAFGVAVTRERLFEIDLFVNRALVYGALTICVVAGYALPVALISQIFADSGSFLIALVVTGIIAVAFQPLRDRLQRAVDHLMYGDRQEPYRALAQLGQRLKLTLSPDAMLSAIVETVASTLKLPYVALAIGEDDSAAIVATWGSTRSLSAGTEAVVTLTYQGETVGRLLLTPRLGERELSEIDRQLLTDIAHHAGIAVHAVRLTADLQQSRERLVNAREEERRRLRRDLHDGLGPTLASIAQRIEVAALLVERDPAHSTALLHDIESQVRTTIADIRRLVYDLRPPTLDQYGLVGAIHAEIASWRDGPLQITLHAAEPLPPLPAAVEVAAYRIVQEALTNVVRHAQAQRCTIRLHMRSSHAELDRSATQPAWLEIVVADDGCGIPGEYRAGVGLNAMRERVAELGGTWLLEPNGARGTRVIARLPMPGEEA